MNSMPESGRQSPTHTELHSESTSRSYEETIEPAHQQSATGDQSTLTRGFDPLVVILDRSLDLEAKPTVEAQRIRVARLCAG